jgi:enamine deaminase RidA (YjgF/YER057c/UK114 family)
MQLSSPRGSVSVAGSWRSFYDETGVPSAIQSGDLVRVTGHTGTVADGSVVLDPSGQIRQTFHNVSDSLEAAGLSWDDVVELTTYTVGLRLHGDVMLQVADEFLSKPFPAWNAVGVVELWEQGAIFELQCVAVRRT